MFQSNLVLQVTEVTTKHQKLPKISNKLPKKNNNNKNGPKPSTGARN